MQGLVLLTNFSSKACAMALVEAQNDLSAAAANLFAKQEELVQDKKDALMAEGTLEEDLHIDDLTLREVAQKVEAELVQKVEEAKTQPVHARLGVVALGPLAILEFDPGPESGAEQAKFELKLAPQEEDISEEKKDSASSKKDNTSLKKDDASSMKDNALSMQDDASLIKDDAFISSPKPSPPQPKRKAPNLESLLLNASPIPSPRPLQASSSNSTISPKASVESLFQKTHLHKIPGSEFKMPDMKMFDLSDSSQPSGKASNPVKDMEAIKNNIERIRNNVETALRLEAVAMSDVTTSSTVPTLHVRYRAKTRAIRTVKCYRGWIKDEVKLKSLVSELRLWHKIASVGHHRRSSNPTSAHKGAATSPKRNRSNAEVRQRR